MERERTDSLMGACMVRRLMLVCAGVALCAVSLGALTVAEQEIRRGAPVEFVNYRGRYTRIVTPAQLRGAGLELSRMATLSNRKYIARRQYSVIRAIDLSLTNRFDADIFMLEPASDIVDINGVRDVLGGYLSGQYGYSERDGRVLATFVTYYNAIYRGQAEYVRTVYKPVVSSRLVPAHIGIDRNYRNWPGRTQMLVPLVTSTNGGKPKLDIDGFTGKEIISTLTNRPDKGIPERKDLIEIKKDDLDKKQQDLDKEKKKLEDDKKKLDEDKKDLKKQENDLDKKKEDLKKETDPVKAEIKKDEVTKTEQEIEKKKDEIKKGEEAIKKDETKVDKKQDDLDKKKDEVKKDETNLKKDELKLAEDKLPQVIKDDLKKKQDEVDKTKQELDKKADELKKREDELKKGELDRNVYDGGLYYLKVIEPLDDGHYKNEMVLINPVTRKVALVSSFKNICGNRYDVFGGGAVVIGYEGNHTSGHFLVLLDPKKLDVVSRGRVNVYWRSFVEVKADSVYAVVQDNGFFLGKFDGKLEQVSRSKEKIDKDSFISFFGDYIYVNSHEKKILVFQASDLSLVDTIQP